MPIELKMPALSPTMEEGTLAKWLVKEGDEVKSGDILAEIETDKATMEFEAVDEGKIAKILVPEGTDGVKVGAPIAILAGEGEDAAQSPLAQRGEGRRAPQARRPPAADARAQPPDGERPKAPPAPAPVETPAAPAQPAALAAQAEGDRIKASPLASGLRRRRTSTSRRSRAAAPAGASSAPMSMPPPARRLLPLRLAPLRLRPRSARTSSCPARSSRRSRTRRSSFPTCARPSRAA